MTETNVKICCPAEHKELILITEKELQEYTSKEVAKKVSLEIRQQHDQSYLLILTAAWKEGEFCLGTTRGRPRNFINLNTLIGYLGGFNHVRSITLAIYDSGENDGN